MVCALFAPRPEPVPPCAPAPAEACACSTLVRVDGLIASALYEIFDRLEYGQRRLRARCLCRPAGGGRPLTDWAPTAFCQFFEVG